MMKKSLLVSTTFMLLSLCSSVQGTGYSFNNEPERYYYAHPNTAVLIPCEGFEIRDDGTEQPINVIIFKNSERINSDRPPKRLLPLLRTGRISGILIVPVINEDSGSTYQCIIEVEGEIVLSSLQTSLYVGDGLPLAPISNPVQTGEETLTTVPITWGEAPVPTTAPLLGYTIVIDPIVGDSFRIDTVENSTEITLFHLIPGHQYLVSVFGRNSNGNGTASETVNVSTVVPQVPPSPPQVEAVLMQFGTSFSINVSWTLSEIDTDMMTPIVHYTIFYGTAKRKYLDDFLSVNTSDNTTISFILSGIVDLGNYSVGVAAVNSAGRSSVKFYEEFLELPSTTSMQDTILTPQTIIVIGVVGTSVLLILTITILVLLIVYVRRKTTQITVDLNHPDGSIKSDNSPYAKRKGHSSPKKKPSPLHCKGNVELNDYEAEPRRAGSRSPERSGFEESTRTIGSLSTFMDSSLKV